MPLKEYKPGTTFPGVIGRTFDQSEPSCHDPDVRLREESSYEEKKLYARMMEVFVGFLEHTDYHIDRLLQFLKDIGEFENILIMVISDNGASSEGGSTVPVNENLLFNNVPEGQHQLRFEFEVTGKPDVANGKGAPGKAQLYIDGKLVGQAEIPVTTPLVLGLTSGVTCGSAHGSPVTPDYEPPFEFTGKIYRVTVDVSGKLIEDKEAETRMVMARQ
ncbi:hypothetical protein ASJ81_04100 [Methanosarcina spelaei]|uniref:Sulfatase N-terminal domain-containing protein n=1 Tax=Methanosarcina spelaei TaxID=1036679 RepID=A0A2A2HUN6_9EURY|nr:sulfatase-like hydrolase/transferase [Methanosarcina spelaei]PAV13187.1 hypothetical protein ASJ81_04100 [Methanosarcina spelaei]